MSVTDRKRVLLVDTDAGALSAFRETIIGLADVEACREFAAARESLRRDPPELLITNVRLREYNGLHLAFIASAMGRRTRCVVFLDTIDPVVARDAREAGAFFETRQRLKYALRSYLLAALPDCDRRDPSTRDRRHAFRGGRRSTDITMLVC